MEKGKKKSFPLYRSVCMHGETRGAHSWEVVSLKGKHMLRGLQTQGLQRIHSGLDRENYSDQGHGSVT